MRYFLSLVVACLTLLPYSALAATPDLSIRASSIHFSQSTLYAGDHIRIYATIKNEGEVDTMAQVFFYQGPTLIGTSQIVSVIAGGNGDDVYVDFTVPQTAFNILARIQGQDPGDVVAANDEAVTPLYTPVLDADHDGIPDATDNCANATNSNQLDTDHDGAGDACDSDDDNDGIPDSTEVANGTSPTNSDTDGDGSPDGSDAFPLDSNRSTNPPPVVVAQAPIGGSSGSTGASAPTTPSTLTKPAPVVANLNDNAPEPQVAGDSDPQGGAEPVESSTPDNGGTALALGDTGLASPSPSIEIAPTLLTLGDLKLSPDARFSYRQIDWRTYEFDAKPQGDVAGAFGWDFGDGSTSVNSKVTHIFPRSGEYKVTLAVATDDGKMFTDSQIISISFFHLGNPLVDLVLSLLLLLLIALIIYIYRLRKQVV
jgi:hypothetical protein